MARPLRIEYPGAFYHVTCRGNAKQAIFQSDDDMQLFLATLSRVVKRHNWILHAYCLMHNHFHLLIETPDGNLSRGMHNLNCQYCQVYNSRHDRVGHLFQGRYRATIIDREEYFQVVARYIVLNPVRANVASDPLQYIWSSYLDTIGVRTPPAFLTVESILRSFSPDLEQARILYQAFVRQTEQDIELGLAYHCILGNPDFVHNLKDKIAAKQEIREIPRRDRFAGRPELQDIIGSNSKQAERDNQIYVAFQEFGYKQTEIADYLNKAPSTISKIIKHFELERTGP
jgi:putative transposase